MSNALRIGSTTIACDVLVIGGGAAGMAAATAAGRAGARVVLLERYGFLGGLATTAQVGTICGLYLRDTAGAEATPVGGGFAQEFASRLQHAADTKPIRVMDTGLWVLPYPPPAFARVADAVVSESGNITVVLHATVAEAQAEGSRLSQVRALAWNEPLLFRPNTVVDCTGEATAAALAGASAENGGADQAPALVFVLENVDPGLAERGLLEVRRELRRAVESGALPALCERLSLSSRHGRQWPSRSQINSVAGKPRPRALATGHGLGTRVPRAAGTAPAIPRRKHRLLPERAS